ncbi:fungal-specific transcription factor domain-containing protein [Dactylonectria estremocensis]|uniref:Fungal-specific transcription factor domain-containing protein n=1 Tax=Dactylonectria estremocensis TaxID=1079267 RepID=A0A9P9JIH0_9HYPO|nr:fungal-specific transcription factor domain-containing protein [Dactylonectria estremocensis]
MSNAGRLTGRLAGRLVGRQPAASAQSDSQQQSQGATRRNNGRACVTCHQRKIRCDILTKGPPCSNCQSHESSSCRYYEKKKSRAALARQPRGNVAIQPRGQQIITAPATPIELHNPWADDSVPSTSQTVPVPAMAIAGDTIQPDQHQHRGCRPASSPTRDGEGEGGDEQDTHGLAEFIDTQAVRVTEITENSRTYFIGTEFSNLNHLVRQRSHHSSFNQLHFGSQHHARKLGRVPSEALELPEKALTDELVHAYFTHINPGWPIVDEEDFMTKYNSSPDPRETVKLPLLHAILLVGAHVSAPRLSNYRALKACFFRRAKLLIDSRYDEDRRSYVQVALLLTWSCDNLEDIVSNSWYWVGFAARTALGLGMHRDASQSKMLPIPTREWIRIWWVLVQFDVMIATAYGKPQAINLDESDTPTLQECHFEGVPRANAAFVIEHTRLCVIFSKSMRKILALRATLAEKAEARRHADEALAQFIIQLPSSLRSPLPEANAWQSFLHLNYNHFLILLHRPPPRQNPRQNLPAAANDLNICGDAVVIITSIFESLRDKGSMCHLALPIMYMLFTALVHVSTDLNSENPLVIAKSMRMLDSLLISLRELSNHWLFAHSLLRLFEQRATWDHRQGHSRRLQNVSMTDLNHRPADGPHIENSGFSLRPNPTYMSNVNIPNASERSNNMVFTPSSITPDQGTICADAMNPGLGMSRDVGAGSSDVLQRLPYSENFADGSLNMSPDALSMVSFPLALDFLLAGMGNEYECL